MRICSSLLICWYLLQWSLAWGMGLTTLSAVNLAPSAAHAAQTSAAHPHSPQGTEHTSSVHAAHDECHGHWATPTEASQDGSAHCTAHADCHHCCPLGWGNGLGMAGHAAPNIHPSGQMADWHSASWVPDLRPPIA